MVVSSFQVEQISPALHIKMGYVYLVLPLAGIFMTIFTLENLVETLVAKPEFEEVN